MRKSFKLIILSIIILMPSLLLCSVRMKVNKGNRYFKQKKFDKAIQQYRDAQIDAPKSCEVHYNIGNVLYKKKRYKEAQKEYEKATYTKNLNLEAKALYNIGNCLFRQGRWLDAIQYYKKALDINPKDNDAKYNIEFIRKKLKELAKRKKQQGLSEKQLKEEKKRISQGKKQNKQSQKKQSAAGIKKGKENTKKEKSEQEKKPSQKKKYMSEEDAKRILDAFSEKEKGYQKEKRRIPKFKAPYVEQDW